MNKVVTIISIAFSMLLLSACSTMESTAHFVPAAAKPDQAVVYLYRPSEMTNALYSPGVNINGEFKLYTKNGINSRISLTPGEYIFAFQEEKTYTELTPVTLDLDAGSISYIRVSTSLKVRNTTGYEPYARSFKLTQVEESVATKEIAECCLEKRDESREQTQPASKENDDGFSVNKTQNPFSH